MPATAPFGDLNLADQEPTHDDTTCRPVFADFEDAMEAFRKFTRDLGNYVEGSPAQRDQIGFWLPRFQTEFAAHGVNFNQ